MKSQESNGLRIIPVKGAIKGEGQPDRLPGAESGWYHEAREAFVPGSGMEAFVFFEVARLMRCSRTPHFEKCSVEVRNGISRATSIKSQWE